MLADVQKCSCARSMQVTRAHSLIHWSHGSRRFRHAVEACCGAQAIWAHWLARARMSFAHTRSLTGATARVDSEMHLRLAVECRESEGALASALLRDGVRGVAVGAAGQGG
eukprot:10166218-Alexandrium_andersonii.AAC.1